MAERGRRAGWRAAAVLAPAAAILFASTTAWAQRHAPGVATTPVPSPSAARGDDALRAALAADEQRLADLQARLDALSAQGNQGGCAATPGAARTPGRSGTAGGARTSGRSGTGGSRSATGGGGTSTSRTGTSSRTGTTTNRPAPPPPPPPAHTTTGASGAHP